MARDYTGETIIYWPIPGLIEGETSDTIIFIFDTPVANGTLKSEYDERIRIWARIEGVGSFEDITNGDGIDLSGLAPVETAFEFKVEALSTIDGLDRIPVSLTTGKSTPAGWFV